MTDGPGAHAPGRACDGERQALVLDTNVVLDLFVFDDAKARPLKNDLLQGALHWLATPPMRDELARVLDYAHIAARLAAAGQCAGDVLAQFDRHVCIVAIALRAPLSCSDPDDQKFIDLAVQHRCMLLSKDAAVLELKNRLASLQVCASAVMPSLDHNSLGTALARKS